MSFRQLQFSALTQTSGTSRMSSQSS